MEQTNNNDTGRERVKYMHSSVSRSGDLLESGKLLNAFGNN